MIRKAEARFYDRIHDRLDNYGRREAVQLLFGTGWIFYGISIIMEPPRNIAGLFQVTNFVDPVIYGGMWILTGVLGIAAVTNRERRIGTYGFVALILMPLLRGLISLASWVGLMFGWDAGDPRGWATAIIWAVIASVIQIVAGWPEEHVKVPSRRHFFSQLEEGDVPRTTQE